MGVGWLSPRRCGRACRCVVMVGLPYPNPKDPELRERMAFMDANAVTVSYASSGGGVSPGRQYYSDLCMKVPPPPHSSPC